MFWEHEITLRIVNVLVVVAQLSGQLVHHLLEDDGVNVLAQHVEQEPVAHLGLLDDDVDALLFDQSEPDEEQVGTHARGKHNHGPVDHHEHREQEEQEHPEPKEDVDLLIDNVQGQDAHGIVLFNFTGGSKLVEGALCHAGKDVDHGVDAVLLVPLGERDHFDAKRKEGSIKELVH